MNTYAGAVARRRPGLPSLCTLAKDWTPELKEHYIHDAGDEEISDQLFSKETEDFVNDTFEVVDVPNSLAKLLVKR